MAALAQAFDPNSVEPATGKQEPFAAGKVMFMIVNTDVRNNSAKSKDPSGNHLWVEHEVQNGPHAGRKFWNTITTENKSVQALEIGQRELSALCHSVGFLQTVTNSDVLHGLTGYADVGIEPASGGFGPKNVVNRYIPKTEAAEGNGSAKTTAAATSAPAAPSAKKKPWEK